MNFQHLSLIITHCIDESIFNLSVGLGFSGAAAKAAEVAAITWAGSQVTKLPRAAAALVLAPLVDHLLNFIQGTCPATPISRHQLLVFPFAFSGLPR